MAVHVRLVGLALALATLAGVAPGCGDGGEGDLDAFCRRVTDVEEVDLVLDVLEPGTAAEQLTDAIEVYEPLRDVAPSEVRDDLDLLLDFVHELRDELAAVDPDDPTAGFEATAALEERFDEVTAASEALAGFEERHCAEPTSS